MRRGELTTLPSGLRVASRTLLQQPVLGGGLVHKHHDRRANGVLGLADFGRLGGTGRGVGHG